MALGRLTLAVTWLTLAPQWSEAQQQRDCFTSSSVVGAVLGTFFATAIAAALLSALLFAIYKRRVANQSTLSNYLCTTSFHPVSVSHPSAFQSTHLNPLISIRPFQSTHFNSPTRCPIQCPGIPEPRIHAGTARLTDRSINRPLDCLISPL